MKQQLTLFFGLIGLIGVLIGIGSIGIGIIGSLISALMLTGLGDGIWQVIPWAYSMRLSSYFILYKENILIQNSEIIQGIFIMIIFIAITFISQLIFSNHWEGNRENY